MVSTRAMARKAPETSDDKENEAHLALRKKPVRRGTAKAAPAPTKPTARKTEREVMSQPLSPKKNTQVSTSRTRTANQPKAQTEPITATAKAMQQTSRPRRPGRPAKGNVPNELARKRSAAAATPANAIPTAPIDTVQLNPANEDAGTEAHEEPIEEAKEQPELPPAITLQPLDSPPAVTTTILSPSRSPRRLIPVHDDNISDDSDDELCGPKTPLRRGHLQTTKTPLPVSASNEERSQTPSRQLFRLNMGKGTPQTVKVSIRARVSVSPRRPVTVARVTANRPAQDMTKELAMSPIHELRPFIAPLQHELASAMNQEAQSPLNDLNRSASHRHADHANDQDDSEGMEEFSCQNGFPLVVASPQLNEVAEEDSEDELHGEARTLEMNEDLQQEEDVEELDFLLEQETVEGSEYEDDGKINESESDISDCDEEVLTEDHSAITRPMNHEEVAAGMSAPSSPVSVSMPGVHDDEDDSEHETPPAVRLAIDDKTLSHFDDSMVGSPTSDNRISFSKASAMLLKTPHMRTFRSADLDFASSSPPSWTGGTEVTMEEETVCVDPSMIVARQSLIEASRAAREPVTPSMNSAPFMQTPPAAQTEALVMEQMCFSAFATPRMSLLEESLFIEAADDAASGRTSCAMQAETETEEDQDLPLPGQEQDESAVLEAEQSPELVAEQASHQVADLPNYAMPTMSFEARRKSLSNLGPTTPSNVVEHRRTAQTAVKVDAISKSSKAWQYSNRKPTSRRSTLGHREGATPKSNATPVRVPAEQRQSVNTPLPSHKRPCTPAVQFVGPRPRKHTPTSCLSRPQPPKTPIKTPLKAAAFTPGPYPMTPHPAQPLKAVTALVEVFTLDGSSASGPFATLLHRLGARTTKNWTDRVTHVVFKDGSPATLQKIRLANKDAHREILCVNSRWVTDCDREGQRMDEKSEIYAVDVSDVPRGGQRRRKSMEPAVLKGIDYNTANGTPRARKEVERKKSLARVSVASTFWGSSPVKNRLDDGTESPDEVAGQYAELGEDEISTPGMLSSSPQVRRLDALLRTAPVNRLKKLQWQAKESRRTTFCPTRD